MEHLDAEHLADLGQRRGVLLEGAADPVRRLGLVVPGRVGEQGEHRLGRSGDRAGDGVAVAGVRGGGVGGGHERSFREVQRV